MGSNLIHSLVRKGYSLQYIYKRKGAAPPAQEGAKVGAAPAAYKTPGKGTASFIDRKKRIFDRLSQSLAKKSGRKDFSAYLSEDIGLIVEESDFVFITTRESQLKEAAGLIAQQAEPAGKIFFHTSNSLTSTELLEIKERGGLIASFSPLQTFVDFDPAVDLFAGIYFLCEGDAPAVALAGEIAAALGAKALVVDAADKPLFHMAAVSASNFFIALLKFAEAQVKRCGGDFDIGILLPLIEQTLKNAASRGVSASLTGPLQRGEAEILRKHLSLLQGEDAAFYKVLTDYLKNTI